MRESHDPIHINIANRSVGGPVDAWTSGSARSGVYSADEGSGGGMVSVRLDVCGIHLHAHSLIDQLNREYESRVRAFANQTTDNTL